MEPLDALRRVDYDRIWILGCVFLKLFNPILSVKFVDDAMERDLIDQWHAEVDWNEIDAVLLGMVEERGLDEGVNLLVW